MDGWMTKPVSHSARDTKCTPSIPPQAGLLCSVHEAVENKSAAVHKGGITL